MNLWERAKAQIDSLAASVEVTINMEYEGREKYPDEMRRYLRDMAEVSEARVVLSDMERAECVEGCASRDPDSWTFVDGPAVCVGERPALLILEGK